MSENVEIIRSVMDGILQTEKWVKILTEDPQIVAAESQLRAVMETVSAQVPRKVKVELEDAITWAENAFIDAAVLYGISVAQTIQSFASAPAGYTAHILNCIRENGVSA